MIQKQALLAATAFAVLLPLGASAQSTAAISSLPSGFGVSGGVLGVSLSGLYGPPHAGGRLDGDMGFVLGFGNPLESVGFSVGLDITSLQNDFADSGYFNVSVHRMFRFNGGYGSVNATVSGIGSFGTASARDVGGSLVGSFVTGSSARPYMFTVGIANDLNLAQDVQGIFGVGMGISSEWAVSAGVYGDNNAIGVTYFPSWLPNTVIDVALRNIEDENRRGIGVNIGYAFNLFRN